MTAALQAAPAPAGVSGRGRLLRRRVLALIVAVGAVGLGCLLSLSVGSNPIPLEQVWHLLLFPDQSLESIVLTEQRVPRTLLLLVVGAGLGLAGALMQSITRNPLAEPGLLGVNAGASLAVVAAVALAGITGVWFYLWFAFAGAALASVAVYLLGLAGFAGATPSRLALAGIAINMTISSLVQT